MEQSVFVTSKRYAQVKTENSLGRALACNRSIYDFLTIRLPKENFDVQIPSAPLGMM
jgi:hypothetical protein